MHAARSGILVALLLVLAPTNTLAWGTAGHEVVAAIAEERLSPRARAMVREIVGDVPLHAPEIAAWADQLRDPRTRPWHYVNIPFASGRYDARRDCPGGACVVAQIERAREDLARTGSPLRRADALRWLVHLVADLHQPLHAGDGWDRGGNELRVRVGRRREPTNLHRVWDVDVVKRLLRRRGPLAIPAILGRRFTPTQLDTWAANLDPVSWAGESSREARAIYAELGVTPRTREIIALPQGYAEAESPRVEEALERAGVRLAAMLDQAAR